MSTKRPRPGQPAIVMLRQACVWVFWLAALSTHVAHAESIKPGRNFKADGVKAALRQRPVIVLFSLPGCHFCDEIRQNYLTPLVRDAAPGQAPIIREIVITGVRTLVDFGGAQVEEPSLAKHYGIRVAPTVVMLNSLGEVLVPPLVGGDTVGFYDAYLQRALADASHRMGAK